jgi:hypothetical protein
MLKHVGRMANNQRKIVVAYRVVPGEPENCIVVTTENLMADEHDSLMKMVESDAGQSTNELSEVMARTQLPDGRNMLAAFHTTGKMTKAPTSNVEMLPDRNNTIILSELNEIIAQQAGVTVADLAGVTKSETANSATSETSNDVMSDEDLAASYRSQADSLFKEAKALREQAEELVPTKKKTKKTEESA